MQIVDATEGELDHFEKVKDLSQESWAFFFKKEINSGAFLVHRWIGALFWKGCVVTHDWQLS